MSSDNLSPPGRRSRPQVKIKNPEPAIVTITAASEINTKGSSLDEQLAELNQCFAVVAHVGGDRWRRRVFVALATAERHAQRSRARGQLVGVYAVDLSNPVTIEPLESTTLPTAVTS